MLIQGNRIRIRAKKKLNNLFVNINPSYQKSNYQSKYSIWYNPKFNTTRSQNITILPNRNQKIVHKEADHQNH